jgi:hypothetical protein
MAAGNVDLIIEQGEDWTAQVVWTDYYDNPLAVTIPMRMTIRGGGVVVRELIPPTVITPDEIPEIAYNSESGLIQLHLDSVQTGSLNPGTYEYDLWVNVEDTDAYAGTQQVKLIYGQVIVRGRVTTTV